MLSSKKSGFLTIESPFEFYRAVKNYVPAIKCVFVSNEDVFEEPENMEQESIPIRETLKIYRIERSEMKGIYGLNFFYLTDEKPFFTQWYANGKDVWYAVMMMEKLIPTTVLPVWWNMIKLKNGSNVLDCVNSGSTNNVFTIKFYFS